MPSAGNANAKHSRKVGVGGYSDDDCGGVEVGVVDPEDTVVDNDDVVVVSDDESVPIDSSVEFAAAC